MKISKPTPPVSMTTRPASRTRSVPEIDAIIASPSRRSRSSFTPPCDSSPRLRREALEGAHPRRAQMAHRKRERVGGIVGERNAFIEAKRAPHHELHLRLI